MLDLRKRAAIYTRVSSARQKEEGVSLDVQLKACRKFCADNNYIIIREFEDAQSGLDADRPGYQAMLQMASESAFDVVVVWRRDRFGRDTAEIFPTVKSLKRHNVDVASVTEGGTVDEVTFGVLTVMAEEESRRTSRRIRASKEDLAKEGYWSGSAPLGYSLTIGANGKSKALTPNEQAHLITELFRRYAHEKASLADLLGFLRDNGISTSRAAIGYSLKNRAYAGKVIYGQWSRSQFSPKPKEIEYQGQHSPLVDPDTFELVQQRLAENKHRYFGQYHRPKYLFSGLLRCGICGSAMSGRRKIDRKYQVQYECSRRNNRRDCNQPTIFEAKVGVEVKDQIMRVLDPLRLAEVQAQAKAIVKTTAQNALEERLHLQESLAQQRDSLEKRLAGLEDGYFDEEISKDRYLRRRDEYLKTLEELESQIGTLPPLPRVDIQPILGIIDAITWDALDDQAWREIIEGMVDRIVIEESAKTDGCLVPAAIKVLWKPEYEPLLGLKGV